MKSGWMIVLIRLALMAGSLLAVLLGATAGNCSAQVAVVTPERTAEAALHYYLERAGIRSDCFFTIERDRRQPTGVSPFDTIYMDDETSALSISQLIANLKIAMPFALIVQNQHNSVIINIVENSLLALPDYALDEQTSIQFTGLLDTFIEVLSGRTHGRIGHNRGGDWRDSYNDGVTVIEVNAKRQAYRDILSNYLPLSQYARVLWRADAQTKLGNLQIGVKHNGPGLASDKQMISETLIAFSEGEVAFAQNANTKESVEAAQAFIRKQFAGKNPHQVRWAMFFLGKHRIYSSAKLIMDHIDYQYTKCPIIEEAYPALRALVELSSPAAEEAITRMKSERNKLRLELLARVVFGTHTPGYGSELIRAAVATDPAQSKRVEAVLKRIIP